MEAAARTYFNCHARDLTLAQAALLAGLPKAPSQLNPLEAPKRAAARQHYVLERMLAEQSRLQGRSLRRPQPSPCTMTAWLTPHGRRGPITCPNSGAG